jgi:glycosyltransferase involved in cell wall biosynthesis
MRALMISVRADHGGGPRHIELLMRNLRGDIEVYVACPDDQPYLARFGVLASGRIFLIPHRKFSVTVAAKLARFVMKNGIDVIHCHGKGAGLYGRFVAALTAVPTVHTPHGVHVGSYGRLAKWLYRHYENMTSRWVGHLVYVSSEERCAARLSGLWPQVSSSVIVNGVDDVAEVDVRAWRVAARKALGLEDDVTAVVTLSRFDHQKNMCEALDIARLLPEHVFIWIGDGEQKDELERKAGECGLSNVRFLGLIDAPLSMLACGDVYLTTSLWEGMPLALLEAMSLGLPIVATRVVGHVELLDSSGGGLLYAQGNIGEAVNAIRSLSSNTALRRQMGARGGAAQRSFYSARLLGGSVAALYEKLLTAGRAA